ncbi:phosphatidate cytidylyltransferase [Candidatus Pelagibacter sp.]|nr:phosphatidate cytidylyltransferase [Candidatus Pelagibacter sp.]
MKKEFKKRIYSSVIIIPIALFFVIQGSVFFTFFLSTLFLVTSYEWINITKNNNFIKIFGVIFLIISFYSTYELRNYAGLHTLILIILVCIFTDIGGYVFGKFFKGPKLTKISPNKTYAGFIGGFILSVVVVLSYKNYIILDPLFVSFLTEKFNYNFDLSFLIFILAVSLISQLGDLIISYFKRLAKVKDTGKIIPGHGGILDRIDGLIFAIPFSYLFLIS